MHRNDVYLALLGWRITPSGDLASGPTQHLLGRRTSTLPPAKKETYQLHLPLEVQEKLQKTKERQANYYNRHLKPLESDDTVRIKLPQEQTWTKAECPQGPRKRKQKARCTGETEDT